MRRAGERSPPAASSPLGSSSACSRGGNHSASSCGASQVGLVPMTHEGIPVQGVDALEELFVELAPEARLEAYARLRDAAALAPRLLALLRREGGEVVIEARVAAVAPVKLAVAPQQPAAPQARGARRLVEKQGMSAGEPMARGTFLEALEQPRGERLALEVGAHQQAGSGRRCERRADGELGVIAAADALVGPRPGEVEHEFAEGMRLDEGGGGGGEPAAIAERQVERLPARRPPHAM